MLTAILFFIGFFLLIKGADWLVTGSSFVAGRFGVSELMIGLTIVAFGTSAPELVVNIIASFQGNTEIAIGNIVGSNIANILLILGVAAIIYPLKVQKSTVWKEIPFALLGAFLIIILANDMLVDGATSSAITRIDGFVLLGFFILFLYYVFGSALKPSQSEEVQSGEDVEAKKDISMNRSVAMIIGGMVGLVIGGKWIVDGAISFASAFGVSEALIGLTVVAIGTSLPELATSAVAAFKKNVDIAVGNIVGSNIFNIFWIVGLSSLIKPLPFDIKLNFDMFVALGATVLLFLALFVGKKHTVEKWQGVLFVVAYVAYIVILVFRG